MWLTLHYSNSWANPAHQTIPTQWQGISFAALKDSMYNYTERVVNELIVKILFFKLINLQLKLTYIYI